MKTSGILAVEWVSSSNPRVNVPSLRCPRQTAGVVLLPPRGTNLDTWLSDPAGAGDQDINNEEQSWKTDALIIAALVR